MPNGWPRGLWLRQAPLLVNLPIQPPNEVVPICKLGVTVMGFAEHLGLCIALGAL